MNEPYKTKAAAEAACSEYQKEVEAIREKYGVWEISEDSCCNIYVTAEYLDGEGTRKILHRL